MMDDAQNNGTYTGGFAFGDQGGAQSGGMVQPPAPQNPAPAPTPPAPMAGMAGTTAADNDQGSGPPADDPNYRFGAQMESFSTTIKLPAHALNLDESKFLSLLAGSISLTRDEKKKIIDSVPKLRQEQVDELMRIFEEERSKFIELSPKHGAQLKKLELEHLADWRDIELMFKAESKSQEDDQAAADLRKQLGL